MLEKDKNQDGYWIVGYKKDWEVIKESYTTIRAIVKEDKVPDWDKGI